MVIEVKTNLKSEKKLFDAVENITAAKQTEVTKHINGLIFAFASMKPHTIFRHLSELKAETDLQYRPIALVLFEEGAIIQQKNISNDFRFGGGESPYELIVFKGENKSALALTYLLLIFLRVQFAYSDGFSSSENLIMAIDKFLSEEIQKVET